MSDTREEEESGVFDLLSIFFVGFVKVLIQWVWGICLFFIPDRFLVKDVSKDTVLITGGGSGMGRLLALKFGSKGSHIVVIDINEKGLIETASLVQETGGRCSYYVCDVSDRKQVYATAARIQQEVGFVSIVINNAGITGSGKPFCDLDDEKTIQTMNVNTLSQFWVTKAFLPEMKKRNQGHLVFISSFAGLSGGNRMADYCASKFAVIGIAETVTLEVKEEFDGIQTTLVCPYLINTGLFDGAKGSRFLPTLDPEWTANRIMQAILTNQTYLVMPRSLYFTMFFKSFLPVAASFELYKSLDGFRFMQGFRGREPVHDVNSNERRKNE